MSGMKDFQRGEQAGYSGFSKGPAGSAAERMGRASGEARRDWEQGLGSNDGRLVSAVPLKLGVLILGMAVLIGFAVVSGRSVSTALVLVALLMGIMLTGALRRVLRFTTPVYLGAMVGLFLGCLRLFMTDAPLRVENLIVYPLLGAVLGLGVMFVSRLGRRQVRAE